jgi:glucose/mannose-6-phosphate isomerase
VIYGPESIECVLTRWRCQIEENAKMLAYSNVFPELNHNEIVGWEQQPDLLKRIAIISLRERDEADAIARRIEFTLDILTPYAGDIIRITAEERTFLGRLLSLICLGDWVSFYLAIGTRQDPFPIQKIDALKSALARP